MQDSPVYNELNKAWKSTCRIVLGDEIGELKEYENWLKDAPCPPTIKKKSWKSGKDISFSATDYCEDSKFTSLDELQEIKPKSLSINEIKDIDTLLAAFSEQFEYCGNKIYGKSSNVKDSDFIVDSSYVIDSSDIEQSTYIYSSKSTRLDSKYLFGGYGGASEFGIKCLMWHSKRSFESLAVYSSDAYFSWNVTGCQDIMFSFNAVNKRNCIGNLELPREKYIEIKRKLLSEMIELLKKDKRIFTVFDLANGNHPNYKIDVTSKKKEEDFSQISSAFSSTFKTVFKKDPGDLKEYEPWLSGHLPQWKNITSPFGNKTYKVLYGAGYALADIMQRSPDGRIVNLEEAKALTEFHLDASDMKDLSSIKAASAKIAFFNGEFDLERNHNAIDTPVLAGAFNTYRVFDATNNKFSAMCGHAGDSEYVFGCTRILNSKSCIKCYYSQRMSRCFEVDSSTNCSDTMFSHNCEGLNEAMFCFNTKAKRYVIGNAQLPPEQYRKIKEALVSQMADEIIRNKSLKYDIFNVGCAKK